MTTSDTGLLPAEAARTAERTETERMRRCGPLSDCARNGHVDRLPGESLEDHVWLPECDRCEEPITGTPVTDPDDPLGRKFCSGECLDSEAEQAGGAFAVIEYDTEFD